MSISDIITGSGGIVFLLLTLVQIAPIKVNPWNWIAKSIGRAINGEVVQKVELLEERVTEVKYDLGETKALTARTRLLRFNDELLQKTKHTKEHFDQILVDIDTYEKYCKEHPEFENGIAVSSIRHIHNVYDECMEKNSFL